MVEKLESCLFNVFKPGFQIVFKGLYGSLGLLSLCQSFMIAEGISGSPRVFYFVFAEGLPRSLE